MVEVNDADREAARKHLGGAVFTWSVSGKMLSEAFARHRHQALSTQAAEIDALRAEVAKQNGELYAKATPRPWEVDSERDADGPDRHTYYKMFGPDGKVLFDTLNSDVAYLHTDIDYDADGPWEHVWDEQGRVNFELVAHAVNNIEDYEATIAQLRDRVAGLETENERLSKMVTSRLLPGLLEAEEQATLVDFIKFLRADEEARALLTQNEVG